MLKSKKGGGNTLNTARTTMTKNDVKNLKPHDRVTDIRDDVSATVLDVNDFVLRVRYDDTLSSAYLHVGDCGHLEMVGERVTVAGS